MVDKTSFYSDVSKLKFKKTLIYPKDLGEKFYPDCVCFTIQKRTGVAIDAVVKAASNMANHAKKKWDESGVPKGLQKKLNELENTEKAATEKKETALEVVKDYYDQQGTKAPDNMFELIAGSFAGFGREMSDVQDRSLTMGKSGANILGSIYLNMPNGIQFNEAANWSGQELGFMGNMAKDFVSGGGASGDIAKTLTGAAAGSAGGLVGAAIGVLPSLVAKLGIGGGMLGAGIGAMAAGTPLQKGFESALGVAQNPYMEMMFSGIGFRSFQFEFIMRPRDADEVNTVAEILTKFRTFTKPTFSEGKLGKSFMDYPMEFKIEFLTSGERESKEKDFGSNTSYNEAVRTGGGSFKTNTGVPKLKNCVCDNVSSNFTPQSIWAAHNGGRPVAVTLGLSFQETELVMAEDVMGTEAKQGGQDNKGGY